MSKNIQDTIIESIKLAKRSGLRTVTKSQIKTELMKTPLGQYEKEKFVNDKNTKLDRMLDQALYQLTKNNRIKKKGKGKYSIDTDVEKYRPVICRHIEIRPLGSYCPVKKVYIGDPRMQCELLHGTDYEKKTKQVIPMCPGYTDKKPTAVSIEYAKRAIKKEREKIEKAYTTAVKKRGR